MSEYELPGIKAEDCPEGLRRIIAASYRAAVLLNNSLEKPSLQRDVDRRFLKEIRDRYGVRSSINTIRDWKWRYV